MNRRAFLHNATCLAGCSWLSQAGRAADPLGIIRPAPRLFQAHASQHHAKAAATYMLVTEPDQGLSAIYNLIASAKKSIDMTMYELTDTAVTTALGKAAAAGIAVRVILNESGICKTTNTPAYNQLEESKCGVHWANPAYADTHQKTITVDQTISAIMTLNLTPAYYASSRDFAVITNDETDAAAIETTFDADFKNAVITPPTGENLVWSPTNATSALAALINGATKTLLISQEEFKDATMAAAVESAAKRGVAVSLVQEYSDNETAPMLPALKSAGVKIAVYTSKTGYYIHAKTVLADYGTPSAKLFVGSENFSTESLTENRELGLVLSDAACMAGVNAAISKDFTNGTPF